MKIKVDLVYDPEYDGYVAECPSLPGCISQGKNISEAMANVRKAVRAYLNTAKKLHLKIPHEVYDTQYITV